MKLFFVFAAMISLGVLSSCNTTIGLGRDMRVLGEGMEKSAEKSAGADAQMQNGAPIY